MDKKEQLAKSLKGLEEQYQIYKTEDFSQIPPVYVESIKIALVILLPL